MRIPIVFHLIICTSRQPSSYECPPNIDTYMDVELYKIFGSRVQLCKLNSLPKDDTTKIVTKTNICTYQGGPEHILFKY